MDAFTREQVVPQVIRAAPKKQATVQYKGNVEVTVGGTLNPKQVVSRPNVTWPTKKDKLYTIAFTDPDVPSRDNREKGEFRHWLVVNIPGTDVSSGDTISMYIGAGPPPRTDKHRYIFLVYEQKGKIENTDEEKQSITKRINWKVQNFADKYELGDPVAGNFFLAEYDSSVKWLPLRVIASKLFCCLR